MFINPKVAIEKGWIKGIKDLAKQVQPNAIDFTLDQLRWVNNKGCALVTEEEKMMRELHEEQVDEGLWTLHGQGGVYDGTSDVYVEVPEGVTAVLFTRSTFARNGVLIASGLYDSGYKGQIGFTIYTHGGSVAVKPGTRIGQIAFVKAESAAMYAGQWNHEQGTHYTDKVGVVDKPSNAKFDKPKLMEQTPQPQQTKPTQLEPLIGSNPNKSERAQELEDAHQWDSDQGGKPAGTKTFL